MIPAREQIYRGCTRASVVCVSARLARAASGQRIRRAILTCPPPLTCPLLARAGAPSQDVFLEVHEKKPKIQLWFHAKRGKTVIVTEI